MDASSMAKDIATNFGGTNVTKADLEYHASFNLGLENPRQYVRLVRKNCESPSRGVYTIPHDFSVAEAAPKERKARAPKVAAGKFQPTVENAPLKLVEDAQEAPTELSTSREFSRIRSSDLLYHPIEVPSADPSFIPFGAFDVVRALLSKNVFAPAYIVGDSGYGKTVMVEQACAKVGRPLAIVQVTNETTEDDLIGGLRIIDGDSVFEYGPVIRAYREGAVLLLDEIDQGTTSLMCLQNILQRKPYQIKKTGETIHPHPDFTVIATGNTKGLGDDVEGRFIGAQLLNEAMLERFTATMEQFAPTPATERKILSHHIDDEAFIDCLVQWANITREARKSGSTRREIQTRRLVHIATNYSALQDKKLSIELALGRFGQDDAKALMMLYTKIDPTVSF